MDTKYFGNWSGPHPWREAHEGRTAIIADFFERIYDDATRTYKDAVVPESFPTEDEILFATYQTPSYDGAALVIYEQGGKVFEVNGSHCSCYGLEGQWTPEETSWGALAMRKSDYSMDGDDAALVAYLALVAAHLQEAA
jgi:hypothetical protein